MKEAIMSRITPQRKIIGTNDKFRNTGIKRQQGTTRVLYDTLPLDGDTTLRFFEGSNNRDFPYTNTGADGNRLGVGSSLAIERIYLSVVTTNDAGTDFVSITDLATAGDANLEVGELQIEIANSQVLKQVPILSFDPRFNKSAWNSALNNFEFDTQLTIPPLLEFVFRLRVNDYTPITNGYLRLSIEGTGAIIAPRTTF